MSFLRHVGKMNDRKVAIVFREIPNEPHMCLVTYTETLNAHIHDPLMRTIESDIGQNSENLADALNRSYTQDGKIILQVLHHEGLLKKVQTSQVVVTPNPTTKIKLDELNKILDEMKQGEQAVQRLAEMDNSRGMQNPVDVARRMRPDAPANIPAVDGIIGDTQLAQQRLQQAQKMESEARGLLAEAKRLTEEAQTMDPTLNNVHVATLAPAPKKRGRPAKAKVTV
jgi:hypothetical protein